MVCRSTLTKERKINFWLPPEELSHLKTLVWKPNKKGVAYQPIVSELYPKKFIHPKRIKMIRKILLISLLASLIWACSPITATPTAPQVGETPRATRTPNPFAWLEFDSSWTKYEVEADGVAKMNLDDSDRQSSCVAITEAQDESPLMVAFESAIHANIRPMNGKFTVIHVRCPFTSIGDTTRFARQFLKDNDWHMGTVAIAIRPNSVDCSWWACDVLPENITYSVRGAEALDTNYATRDIYTGNWQSYWTAGYPAVMLMTCTDVSEGQYAVLLAPGKTIPGDGVCNSGTSSVTGVAYIPMGSFDEIGLELAMLQKAEKLISERGNNLDLIRVGSYPGLIGWWHRNIIDVQIPTDLGIGISPTMIPDTLP